VRADYAEAERLIAEQLTGLQRDAAWTKSYMVSALLLTKECMQVGTRHTGAGPVETIQLLQLSLSL
jgi:hypothetical protein